MKFFVQVKAGAKIEKIEEILLTPPSPRRDPVRTAVQPGGLPSNEGRKIKNYKVWVKAPAKENKANLAVVKLLAKHFQTSKSKVRIISGQKSKKKLIEIG